MKRHEEGVGRESGKGNDWKGFMFMFIAELSFVIPS